MSYNELSRTLTVNLPAPSLQTCFLDESQSYVVRRDTAIFADPLDHLEDSLRQNALIYYRDTAIEEGILIDAENDARSSLTELLAILVNDESVTINIVFEDAPLEPTTSLKLPVIFNWTSGEGRSKGYCPSILPGIVSVVDRVDGFFFDDFIAIGQVFFYPFFIIFQDVFLCHFHQLRIAHKDGNPLMQ